jgi:hypothetical protein
MLIKVECKYTVQRLAMIATNTTGSGHVCVDNVMHVIPKGPCTLPESIY